MTYSDLSGRRVVVTGGAKGIGAACVRTLADMGAKVSLFDLDAAAARGLADELAGSVRAYVLDVTDSAAVKNAFAQSEQDWGPPTLLVNNAGVNFNASVMATTDEQWDRMLGVNLKSYFLCAREALPRMIAAGQGAMVHVASVQSFISQKGVAAYCASKAGVLGLSRSIAVDHAPIIRSNAVCPGSVDTPMLAQSIDGAADREALLAECRGMHLLKRIGRPEEIAQLITFLLSDASGFITGEAIRIDGGLGLEIGGNYHD